MRDQARTLFFIHLPKTGGLTVSHHIYGLLERGEAYPSHADSPTKDFHDIARLRAHLRGQEPQPRFVTGHFPFYLINDFKHAPITATVVREPVERTLSQLKMLADDHREFDSLSPEAIYDTGFYSAMLMHNLQTRLLSAQEADEMRNFADVVKIDDARLAIAKANLRRVDILGLQSNLEDFIATIVEQFGLETRPIENINVRYRSWEISPAFRRRIADDCRYDCELYDYARQLVAERAANINQ